MTEVFSFAPRRSSLTFRCVQEARLSHPWNIFCIEEAGIGIRAQSVKKNKNENYVEYM